MAGKNKPTGPPSPDACENALAVLQSSEEPLTARDLSRRLEEPYPIKEANLTPVLDEEVAAGRLFRCPGKTAKGKPRYWHRDAVTMAHESALEVLRRSNVPLTAAQVRKAIVAPITPPEADVTAFLDERIADGTLYAIPKATAKGKPRYWDRDAKRIAQDSALAVLQGAETPLTAKQVVKEIVAPVKLSEEGVTAFLDEQVAAGAVYAIPKETAKRPPRYWSQDVIAYGRQAIRQTLREKGPQSEAQLKKAAKGLDAPQFAQSLDQALAAKEAWQHPPLRGKTIPFGPGPPLPEPYLAKAKIGETLGKLAETLYAAGVTKVDLRRAVVEVIVEAGVSLASDSAQAKERNGGASGGEGSCRVDLIALMKEIEPGASRGALVRSRDLRSAAKLGKEDFDREVMALAGQGWLSLHRHDYVSNLSDEEREGLVSGGHGAYYTGIAIRQN